MNLACKDGDMEIDAKTAIEDNNINLKDATEEKKNANVELNINFNKMINMLGNYIEKQDLRQEKNDQRDEKIIKLLQYPNMKESIFYNEQINQDINNYNDYKNYENNKMEEEEYEEEFLEDHDNFEYKSNDYFQNEEEENNYNEKIMILIDKKIEESKIIKNLKIKINDLEKKVINLENDKIKQKKEWAEEKLLRKSMEDAEKKFKKK